MKSRHKLLSVLPVIMLACGLLPAPVLAQFTQQAKLIGTDIVGSTIIYTVDLPPAGDVTVSGTITTDGNLGTLTVADLLDFDLIVSSSSLGASNEILGPEHGILDNTSLVRFEGVTATDSTLFIRPPGVIDIERRFPCVAQVIVTPVPPGFNAEQLRACTPLASDGPEIGLSLSGVEVATHGTSVPGASQGYSVSLSGDGSTAIVGGPGDNFGVGAAWVYTRAGGVWSQQAKLVGTGAIGEAHQGAVSLSSDGNTAIVGGYQDNNFAGAAWVYTRSGGVWSQQTKLVGTGAIGAAFQGVSVALSGDGNTAIIGGSNDNGSAGAAWVFTRSGATWSQQAKLVGTDAIGATALGNSASLSADGNMAIVGGQGDNINVGAAWVYTRSGGVWSQQTKLVGTGAIGAANQGFSVSLSADGNTAISGGHTDNINVGAAWVFTRSGATWSQQAKLLGTGAIGGGSIDQGSSVSLSGNGNIAIVGGFGDDSGVGAAWVFTRAGTVWNQQAKLVGTGAIGAVNQGFSVSLSGNGSTALVGGPYDIPDGGAAWVYAEPVFAGTPGKANCYGQSVAALVQQYGGLKAAAAALGFDSVEALQGAIQEFCVG
jgi:hypothetical protein